MNSGAPSYFIPIAFKKELLQKYYNQPEKYQVQDGVLICGDLWLLKIDNHHEDHITAYLGDLGEELPESEQVHWKEYNIIVDHPLSSTEIKRDFEVIPADSPNIEHQKVIFNKNYM